jgi:hypothetical protein
MGFGFRNPEISVAMAPSEKLGMWNNLEGWKMILDLPYSCFGQNCLLM